MYNKIEIADFHAHILPCADHGSDSLETSLWQLRSAANRGVTRIIATPHFYSHRHTVEAFAKRRDDAYNALKDHIPNGIDIKLGAEALICHGFENLPEIEKLFIEGTKTLLLELPDADFQDCYCDTVSELVKRNIDIIIAHADRYHAENIDLLIKSGAKLQLNASSVLGLFKRRDVYAWLKAGVVVALGSDIHEKDSRAYRQFSRAIKRIEKYSNTIKKQTDYIWNQSETKK